MARGEGRGGRRRRRRERSAGYQRRRGGRGPVRRREGSHQGFAASGRIAASRRGPARRTSRRTRSSPESTGIRCSRTARLVRTRRLRLRARICPCSSPRSTATPTRAISSVSPRAAGSQPTALPRTGAGRYRAPGEAAWTAPARANRAARRSTWELLVSATTGSIRRFPGRSRRGSSPPPSLTALRLPSFTGTRRGSPTADRGGRPWGPGRPP